jgi:hypothetical protein
MQVGAREGKVDLDLIILLLGTVLVEEQDDMGGKDLAAVLLKMGDLVGHMGMNGRS